MNVRKCPMCGSEIFFGYFADITSSKSYMCAINYCRYIIIEVEHNFSLNGATSDE